ncbi:nucleotidyl transferase AbiEii/AbiGii toxin family protein [Candidatus Collierbacteria bacterium]|nr:nucleotidyl transferase AbiEii/AbiGii toxin family protein [Candidatus Collierbacteria bacterium]
MDLSLQILNKDQVSVANKLGFLSYPPYYLGGGTALALQFGHRTSLDFDFYSQGKLDVGKLLETIKGSFEKVEVESQSEDTLLVIVDGVRLSVFYYPYPLIDGLLEWEGKKMASLKDIAAMKVVAIVQRARQRDFIDMYYLIQKLKIEEIIKSVYKKYPWYEENNRILFTALTYFEEADSDPEAGKIAVVDQSVTWEKVKASIKDSVSEYLASGL